MQSDKEFYSYHKAPPAITFVQDSSEASTSNVLSNIIHYNVSQRNALLTDKTSRTHVSALSLDHCGDFITTEDENVLSRPVFIATETEILLPEQFPPFPSTDQYPRTKETSTGTLSESPKDTYTVSSANATKDDCGLLRRDTTLFIPHEHRDGRQLSTATDHITKIRTCPSPRVLIVADEDSGLTDHLDFHLRALDRRMSRDDMQAMRILKRFRKSVYESDDRERYYKRKHLLAWQAAIAMPRTKKTPFETDIPLAATSVLWKRLPKRERIRRRILQAFGCCHSKPPYVDEVLTQLSVDNFNARYDHMKAQDVTLGFGIQRRASIFSTSHPKFIEYDEPDY